MAKTSILLSVHCELSQWTGCNATCGEGIKSRNIVIPAKHGGNECSEELTQPCNLKPCPGKLLIDFFCCC